MFSNLNQCGNCGKEAGQDGNEFLVVILAFKESPKFIHKALAICPECLHKIPEPLRAPQNKVVDDADVITICRQEKNRDEIAMPPFCDVRKSIINLYVGDLGLKLWPRPINR